VRYFIFKVNNSLDEQYYILNNQYIGYIGLDGDSHRGIIESYQPYATSSETNDRELHRLNCESYRFTLEEIKTLRNRTKIFTLSKDKALYQVYFPNRNSSNCYLKEIDGDKTIRDL